MGVTCINTWKLSLHHLLFSKLQQKHKAEEVATVDMFAGTLTKQMLRKADYYRKAALDAMNINEKIALDDEVVKEDMSDMSDASVKKLSILFYPLVTNNKG